ncbi:MAG TPA: SIS domain-containing protein [Streptosporangiaceae bacterium]|jgi:D-sedoheptulose 7-phosphate isomerase|nr:SIS domain-containing protein [Streptosporangiaceae bacterium]
MIRDAVAGPPAAMHDELDEAVRVVGSLRSEVESAQRVAELIVTALQGGRKVLTCGNGGSALEAQHFAAELIGHFRGDRAALAAVALTPDPGVLTAISNDFGYDDVFARQVQGLAGAGDVLLAFTTSGNSGNVVAATRAARDLGAHTVALTGGDGGRIAALAENVIVVASADTARIQEGHLILLHMICEQVDAAFRETRQPDHPRPTPAASAS